jgi:hypothetical protein
MRLTDATPPVEPMMMRVGDVAAEHEYTVVSTSVTLSADLKLDDENPRQS